MSVQSDVQSATNTAPKQDIEVESEEEEDYEVEMIVGVRVFDGNKEYKVRWKGFGYRDDSWFLHIHIYTPFNTVHYYIISKVNIKH